MSLRMKESRASLWISQPCVLRRIYALAVLAVDYAATAAVDYDAAHLWITHAGASCGFPSASALGRIYPGLSVLWISRFAGRAEQVIDVSVRRSGEEGGTYGTHRTHRTVADGTKGHAGSPLYTSYISARWRSTEMCPCDAASKTVRLVESGKAASFEFRSLCLLEFKVRSG